jgi:phosphotransferase system HPr (HPr) family protein
MLWRGDQKMNCKSLMSLLAFPVCPGDEVTIRCEGPDEAEALECIYNFLNRLDQ